VEAVEPIQEAQSAPVFTGLNDAVHGEAASTAQLQIVYYTDPLCSWSWAFEPQWRRLRYALGNQVTWTYQMGGMIDDWQHYNDPLNDIHRPVQMGPQWFQVRALSGMPLNERIWYEDPPTSSYPACLGVKAAQRQGAVQGESYLRRLREAVMLERRNIARREVLLSLAEALAVEQPAFDARLFAQDLDNPAVLDDLRSDLKDARYRNIGRFPTLILRHPTGQAVILVGYRPYAALCDVLARLAPELTPLQTATDLLAYISQWGRMTAREVAEGLGIEQSAATQRLDAAIAEGWLIQTNNLYSLR